MMLVKSVCIGPFLAAVPVAAIRVKSHLLTPEHSTDGRWFWTYRL